MRSAGLVMPIGLRVVQHDAVVHAFQTHGLQRVQFHDDLLGVLDEYRGISNGGGGNDGAVLVDRKCFHDGDVDVRHDPVIDILSGLRQMHVHVIAGAVVDSGAEGFVCHVGHAVAEHAGFCELGVDLRTERGAGIDVDLQCLAVSAALCQCVGDGLGVAGGGEAADAQHHVVFDHGGGVFRAHDQIISSVTSESFFDFCIHLHDDSSYQ